MSSVRESPASEILENADFLIPTTLTEDDILQLKLNNKQRATVLVEDLKKFTEHVNEIVRPDKRSVEFNSLDNLNTILSVENLNLQEKTVILDRTNQVSSQIQFEVKPFPDEDILGYSKVNVVINPLENIMVDSITPDLFDANNTLVISNLNNQSYFGINKVTLKNVAIQDNAIHVIKDNLIETVDFSNNTCFGAKKATIVVPVTSTTIELTSENIDDNNNLNLSIKPEATQYYEVTG